MHLFLYGKIKSEKDQLATATVPALFFSTAYLLRHMALRVLLLVLAAS
jgi:hypothetical protein